ncbi:acyclic terpene utilization AtuA family protein [Mycobacterium sp. C31M]
MTDREMLRIANCSGFFGDRLSAAREMVEGGPIDVLTGDYLAELTMMILWKTRRRGTDGGYAATFLKQMEGVLGTCLDRGIKVVVNAGGLNPAGLAERLGELAERLGLAPSVAFVGGDDVLAQMSDRDLPFTHLDTGRSLRDLDREIITANAYLGGWGIAEALSAGADVVICPRVTDAALVVGPSAWAFDWARDDWDRLAGAVAAGHIIECSGQATGGNYSFSGEIPDMRHIGFPIAEMYPDGSSIITKHDGTGGAVTVGTVTSQLLYEIASPQYLNPDVTTDFGALHVEQVGADRVAVTGARGTPPPPELKVCVNYLGGHKQTLTLLLTGDEPEIKSQMLIDGLFHELGGSDQFDEVTTTLLPGDPDATHNAQAVSRLLVTLKHQDPDKLGRRVFDVLASLALASYAGFAADLDSSRSSSAYGVYWPTLIPRDRVTHTVTLSDGITRTIADPPTAALPEAGSPVSGCETYSTAVEFDGPTERVHLGRIVGARSGDKGGNANIGLFADSDLGYAWLQHHLTVERLRELLPEADGLVVDRYSFSNLRALNFVIRGLLGDGVASSTRVDPQAKGLGEFLRSRTVTVPVDVLERADAARRAEAARLRCADTAGVPA